MASMGGRLARVRAGPELLMRAVGPMGKLVPGGEKKGSVRIFTPSIEMRAVAVPMCVMLNGTGKVLEVKDGMFI